MIGAGVARNLPLLLRHPSVLLGQREYVLLLSHMRSYSTLLAHLLGSHAEIAGYAEMNLTYARRRDLLHLRAEVARSIDGRLDGRLVLDKVLHDHHRVARAVLEDPVVHPIFLVRRPADTLSSILRMNERLPDLALYPEEEGVTAYYVDRLATLERLARERAHRAFVLRSEDLVEQPEAMLAKLRNFLRLETPIETSYSTFPLTGVPGKGDFSETIQQGRIRRPEKGSTKLTLRSDLLEGAEDAYARCLATLEQLFGNEADGATGFASQNVSPGAR
jgi:hypothetical protein